MPLLSLLARVYLLRRLFGGGHRRHAAGHRYGHRHGVGYGRRPARYGGHRPRRGSGGFGLFGPFPYYSRRTRGGARVSVGGCCLPIPLALGVLVAGASRLLVGRR